MNFIPLETRPGPTSGDLTIGIIADTHGLLRPEAATALSGCRAIVHAGDLGSLEVYEALSRIAPTAAIRGNVDRGAWAKSFPETLGVCIREWNVYVVHDRRAMSIDPEAAGARVVVSGHSHRPAIEDVNGMLYVNPGSAGPRRFSLPTTLVRVTIGRAGLATELVDLQSPARAAAGKRPAKSRST